MKNPETREHNERNTFTPIKTDRHDITEILLKVALNTITLLLVNFVFYGMFVIKTVTLFTQVI